jgi:N-methylhydantoinase B
VQAGERVRSYSPGGGGIGDPYQRQVAAVLADVRNELVSVASACEEYGVVIDPASLQLDRAATHTLREVRREQSL